MNKLDHTVFQKFIDERYETMQTFYTNKINSIIQLLNEYSISIDQLNDKCLFDETTRSWYSLFDLITIGLCPPVSLI